MVKKRKFWQLFALSAAIIAIVGGGICFIGAVSGWFGGVPERVVLSDEFVHDSASETSENTSVMLTINTVEFDQLIAEQKSFIVISHLPTCTAKILTYLKDYAAEHHFDYLYYPWSQFKDTDFHAEIRFAPTVFIVSNGKLAAFLDADTDADTAKYNDYATFSAWLDSYLVLN